MDFKKQMQYLIRNNMGVFFIGFFTAMGSNTIFGDYELIPTIIGVLLMLFSFYLMNLNSKQKK
ncbi:MAG: hypothetical protein CMC01_08350 [Flavobacteriaceae bacterium]|nr:hypothetical protein [Flavobacteriaceae bacterium]|tara:strand:+ start:368 stop:556 length:189 start_codon:yes stop_codon:yes gene_type:complete